MGIEEHVIYNEAENPNPAQASQTDSRVCDASFAPSMAGYYRQKVMKAVRMISITYV